MRRRQFLIALTGLTFAFPQMAHADYVDSVVAQLEAQGYRDIEITRTLLGRVRVLATHAQGVRELVINPRTGELLRDVWTTAGGRTVPSATIPSTTSGTEGERSDSDDDEDDGDDDSDNDDGDDDDGDDDDDDRDDD
ncbi:MAG: hypothetical protein KIT02_03920 [Devosia sp.]|uniref:hypothetical protein n=1 Tax=Devosia sp. TaxID=1871048 RepID=UPI0024C6144D|nr:hypothetical protein [Devosia sp.]UYO00376.1 MAG: hypothetical protein KIT02_03920 [Devosia sp.]